PPPPPPPPPPSPPPPVPPTPRPFLGTILNELRQGKDGTSILPVGSVKVGYGDRWFLFENTATSRYFAVRSGERPVGADSPMSERRDSPRP
ncbi:MAG: hypothetical protein ACYTFI_23420, partial [Planctomycetota bacterium]